MDINIEELIAEVKIRVPLWNQIDRDYNSRALTEHLWDSIAEKMNISKDDLKKKWRNIRDYHRRELKKLSTHRSGDVEDIESYSTWVHFKSLGFLADQVRFKSGKGSLRSQRSSSESNSISFSEEKETKGNFEIFEPDEPPKKNKKKKDDKENFNSQLIGLEKQKLEIMSKKIERRNSEDDNDAFVESLVPLLRKMDEKRNLECRMKILKTVYDCKFNKDC